ncbi:hypothetical protein [Meridianimarinicoccus marinus]|uniref:hypothetical protein n=1 Tax=Meridianimarinicoccus marinus TaxID=3231483 RepID=UPI00344E3C7A
MPSFSVDVLSVVEYLEDRKECEVGRHALVKLAGRLADQIANGSGIKFVAKEQMREPSRT